MSEIEFVQGVPCSEIERLRSLGVRRVVIENFRLKEIEFFDAAPAPTPDDRETIAPEAEVPAGYLNAMKAFEPPGKERPA
jgi:hypothetical protein